MTWPDLASFLAGFVVGTITGASGKYLADRFTDQRREQECRRRVFRQFTQAADAMPGLIHEMATDVAAPSNALIRDFVVLPSRHVVFNSGGRFVLPYYEDQHHDLMNSLRVLENMGFISDVTSTNVPAFRMTEEFVDLLRRRR